MKANELEMRLVHLTDAPLTELKDIILTQSGTYPSFIETEQDLMTELQTTFRRYEKAKIAFDAPIVPNLCHIENRIEESGDEKGMSL